MEERKEWKAIMAGLAKKDMVSYCIIKSLKVIATDKILTACTNGKELLVNMKWLSKLPLKQRIAVMVHEAKHIVNKHPIRAEEYIKRGENVDLMNIAMDAVINAELRRFKYELPEWSVDIPVNKESWEEIYKKLKKEGGEGEGEGEGKGKEGEGGKGRGKKEYGKNWSGDDVMPSNEQEKKKKEGEVLEEGDEELQKARNEKEIEKVINKKLLEGVTVQKMAGRGAGIWEDEIKAILKPRINWRRLFRREVQSWITSNVVSTWMKINRKMPEMPGLKKLGRPKVWWLVDTSGSMGKEELVQIFSELKAVIAEVSEIEVVEWDAAIQARWKIKSKAELRRIKVKGRGGTEFAGVARELAKEIKANDFVVITTDGYWFDEKHALAEIKRWRSKNVVVATTANEIEGLKNIRLEV